MCVCVVCVVCVCACVCVYVCVCVAGGLLGVCVGGGLVCLLGGGLKMCVSVINISSAVYWLYPPPAFPFPATDYGGSALLPTAHHAIIITDHGCRHTPLY